MTDFPDYFGGHGAGFFGLFGFYRHGIADLVNQAKTIQVNHCRKSNCANYGAMPRTMPGKTGPSQTRPLLPAAQHEPRAGARALVQGVRRVPPIKSNHAIAEEIDRLIETDGLLTPEEQTACKIPDCENFGRTVGRHPKAYSKRGRSPSGGQYYLRKRCGHIDVASTALKLHTRTQRRAVDVFRGLPTRRRFGTRFAVPA